MARLFAQLKATLQTHPYRSGSAWAWSL